MQNLHYFQKRTECLFAEQHYTGSPAELYDPIEYTMHLGGKRLRPTLLLIANAMFGGSEESVRSAMLGIETFHNFTLLHDDLMDNSPLRRGQPTVYRKWDANTAVLSGDTMFALSMQLMLQQPTPRLAEVMQCFASTAVGVCEGQQMDMNFEQAGLGAVSVANYLKMIELKTGVLIAGALKMGALYTEASAADVDTLYRYGLHLGRAFQMQDDLLDGYGDTAVFGKKTGQDIRDNKISLLPLTALGLADSKQREALLSLFGSKECADEEQKVRQVMAIYDAVGLRANIEEQIEAQFAEASSLLHALQLPEANLKPLDEMMKTLKNRKK